MKSETFLNLFCEFSSFRMKSVSHVNCVSFSTGDLVDLEKATVSRQYHQRSGKDTLQQEV